MSHFKTSCSLVFRKKPIYIMLATIMMIIVLVFGVHTRLIENKVIYKQIHLRQLQYNFEKLSIQEQACVSNLKEQINLEKTILTSDDMNLIYECQIRIIDMNLELENSVQDIVQFKEQKAFLQYLRANHLSYDDYKRPVTSLPFTFYALIHIILPLVSLGLGVILSRLYTLKYRANENILPYILKRKKGLFMAEIICGIVVFVFCLLILGGFSFLISSQSLGIGSWLFPVFISNRFVSIVSVLLQTIVLILLFVILSIALIYLVARFSRNQFVSSIISSSVLTIFYVFIYFRYLK